MIPCWSIPYLVDSLLVDSLLVIGYLVLEATINIINSCHPDALAQRTSTSVNWSPYLTNN